MARPNDFSIFYPARSTHMQHQRFTGIPHHFNHSEPYLLRLMNGYSMMAMLDIHMDEHRIPTASSHDNVKSVSR